MKTYLPYIIAASVATILTRFLPYWLFKKKSNSHSLAYLQKYSGLMIMAILIIYSLKSIGFMPNRNGLLMIICLLLTFVLHKLKHNFLLSISLPTILYMVLLRIIE
ncbi:MAG: AzlD domain-containing protein [Neisseriaceae bacterium]|nr:AzlD domain-containing protein [Neisseriaceae bacterium]